MSLLRKWGKSRKGPGRPKGSRDKAARRPRSDKGKSRGGRDRTRPRTRIRRERLTRPLKGPSKVPRLRCPVCGMLCCFRNFGRDHELEAFNVVFGGRGDIRYEKAKFVGDDPRLYWIKVLLKVLRRLGYRPGGVPRIVVRQVPYPVRVEGPIHVKVPTYLKAPATWEG